jgi:hypothetical protein
MFPVRYELGCYIPEDGVLQSPLRKPQIPQGIGWALQRKHVFPVRYELGFYIPEDTILQSHRRGNLKSYIELTG